MILISFCNFFGSFILISCSGFISSPLGGFINHANTPNCIKVELRMTNEDLKGNQYHYKKWNLVTIKDIKQGEELTLTYTFYKI